MANQPQGWTQRASPGLDGLFQGPPSRRNLATDDPEAPTDELQELITAAIEAKHVSRCCEHTECACKAAAAACMR